MIYGQFKFLIRSRILCWIVKINTQRDKQRQPTAFRSVSFEMRLFSEGFHFPFLPFCGQFLYSKNYMFIKYLQICPIKSSEGCKDIHINWFLISSWESE